MEESLRLHLKERFESYDVFSKGLGNLYQSIRKNTLELMESFKFVVQDTVFYNSPVLTVRFEKWQTDENMVDAQVYTEMNEAIEKELGLLQNKLTNQIIACYLIRKKIENLDNEFDVSFTINETRKFDKK